MLVGWTSVTLTDPAPQRSSVRVELADRSTEPSTGPIVPAEPPAARPSTRVVLLALVVLAVGALSWLLRPDAGRTAADDPIAPLPPPSAAPATDAGGESEPEANDVVPGRLDGPVFSPLQTDFGWFAVGGSPRQRFLARSVNGLNWEAVAGGPAGSVLDIGVVEGRLVALTSELAGDAADRPGTTIGVRLQWSDDGIEWSGEEAFGPFRVDPVRPPVGVLGTDSTIGAVVTRLDRPSSVPEVSATLAALPALSEESVGGVADRVCGIAQANIDGTTDYELHDCAGELLTVLTNVGPRAAELIETAQFILENRYALHVVSSGRHEIVELPDGMLVASVVPAGEGFVMFAIDGLVALDHPNRLKTIGLPATLLEWTPQGGVRVLDGAPRVLEVGRNSRLLHRADGRIALASRNAIFMSAAPFEVWTEIASGPLERLALDGSLTISSDHELLVFTEDESGSVWVSRDDSQWFELVRDGFEPTIEGLVIDEVLGLGDDRHVIARSGTDHVRLHVARYEDRFTAFPS